MEEELKVTDINVGELKEDIKILKELVANEHGELLNCWDYGEEAKKAIENILNRLEQDERVIEEMSEYISGLDIDEDICKKKTDDCYMDIYIVNGCRECIIDHFRKKVEE